LDLATAAGHKNVVQYLKDQMPGRNYSSDSD
jgi:hypothetical protein